MATDKNDKSLATLFSDLTRETVDLVRKEIALGRAEVSEKISTAQTAVTEVAIGAAILLAGLFLLLQAVVAGVEMVLPPDMAPWLAPLLVGLLVAGIGYLLLKGGSSKLEADKLMPHRTMNSIMRDKNVVREKVQ